MADAVRVEGLANLRKTLRNTDKDALKMVQGVVAGAAQIVASEARTLAPRRSGRLAESIRGTTSGNKGIVRSRLPYAKVHEYGGTISPRGVPITIAPSKFVSRAINRKETAVTRALEVGFDQVARRNGWR